MRACMYYIPVYLVRSLTSLEWICAQLHHGSFSFAGKLSSDMIARNVAFRAARLAALMSAFEHAHLLSFASAFASSTGRSLRFCPPGDQASTEPIRMYQKSVHEPSCSRTSYRSISFDFLSPLFVCVLYTVVLGIEVSRPTTEIIDPNGAPVEAARIYAYLMSEKCPVGRSKRMARIVERQRSKTKRVSVL